MFLANTHHPLRVCGASSFPQPETNLAACLAFDAGPFTLLHHLHVARAKDTLQLTCFQSHPSSLKGSSIS
jgi:hypothetical protein